MLKVGDKAPDFTLPSHTGDPIGLKDYKGKTLILYFFPRADTPGCTCEANEFRDARKEFEKLGASVLGVSGDSVEDLKKFHDKYSLNFPLAGDLSHKMLEAYGVWQEKTTYGVKKMGIVRTTYVIGPDGRVTHVFPKVKAEGHAAEVLAALKAR
jgi:peroxiredoxin Q/BCP